MICRYKQVDVETPLAVIFRSDIDQEGPACRSTQKHLKSRDVVLYVTQQSPERKYSVKEAISVK